MNNKDNKTRLGFVTIIILVLYFVNAGFNNYTAKHYLSLIFGLAIGYLIGYFIRD